MRERCRQSRRDLFLQRRSMTYIWNPHYAALYARNTLTHVRFLDADDGALYGTYDLTQPDPARRIWQAMARNGNLTDVMGMHGAVSRETMERAGSRRTAASSAEARSMATAKRYLDEAKGCRSGRLDRYLRRSTRRLRNVLATRRKSHWRCLSASSAHQQSRRPRARSLLRLRHDDSRGAEARPAMDRHRHHAPRHLPDREAAERRLPWHPIRSSRHAEGPRRRARVGDADKYQFQWWAVSLVNAVPYGGKKSGADTGIDGHIYFKPDGKTTEKAIVSVKGGGT